MRSAYVGDWISSSKADFEDHVAVLQKYFSCYMTALWGGMTEVERGSGLGSYIKAILYNPTKAATFF